MLLQIGLAPSALLTCLTSWQTAQDEHQQCTHMSLQGSSCRLHKTTNRQDQGGHTPGQQPWSNFRIFCGQLSSADDVHTFKPVHWWI
jgi:hypothetical protein